MTGAKPIRGAILTGDLIGSTKVSAGAVEATMAALAAAFAEMDGWPSGIPSRFARHRGDGWQAAVSPAGRALRASLFVTARLRAADTGLATRFAIGLGEFSEDGPLAEAHGQPFEDSGHALDSLGRGERLALGGAGSNPLHQAIIALLDERTSRWSREQAEAMALYLVPESQTLASIAARLDLSTQAVHYRLTGAGYQAIGKAVIQWETGFANMGERR